MKRLFLLFAAALLAAACPAGAFAQFKIGGKKIDAAKLLNAGKDVAKAVTLSDEEIARFLRSLTSQRVFLFGTAGFGGAPAYFEQILGRVRENLGPEVPVIGTFMCQGRMPQAVRDRYEAMEDSPRRTAMLENFDRAASHPDEQDLTRLKAAVAG